MQKGLALSPASGYNEQQVLFRVSMGRLRPKATMALFFKRGDANQMKERRRHSRIIINQHAWIHDFDESAAAPANLEDCLIVDISESGACIQCASCYQVGQPLAFTYQDLMESGLRPIVGVVMWNKRHSERDYRHGVQFLGLSTQMLRKIQNQVLQMTEKQKGTDGG